MKKKRAIRNYVLISLFIVIVAVLSFVSFPVVGTTYDFKGLANIHLGLELGGGVKNTYNLEVADWYDGSDKEAYQETIDRVQFILNKYEINVEHIPSSIDTFSLIIESAQINKKLYEVLAEIKKIEDVQDVLVDNDIALVAIVGRNMATKVGISAKLFSILGKNNINIKVIAQASQELSIIVGVQNNQFENAIKAIYENLVN